MYYTYFGMIAIVSYHTIGICWACNWQTAPLLFEIHKANLVDIFLLLVQIHLSVENASVYENERGEMQ